MIGGKKYGYVKNKVILEEIEKLGLEVKQALLLILNNMDKFCYHFTIFIK
jgi:hypothetical protein